MKLQVEYLAIYRRTDTFCDSVQGFLHLLQVDSSIKVASGKVHLDGDPVAAIQLSAGEVLGRGQRYFQVLLEWDGEPSAEDKGCEKFLAVQKAVRRTVEQSNGDLETLRDDLSSHYSIRAYPLIHEIENLMRFLITKFMVVTVGREWSEEALPKDVADAVKKSKRKEGQSDYLNVLHQVDFHHLGDLLFAAYPRKSPHDLPKVLKGLQGPIEPSELQDFVPVSNWQRYFRKLVPCEDGYLRTKWERLYEIRCKVAHNAFINRLDLATLETLVSEVKPKLLDAISKLPNVAVPPNEAELVAENAIRNVHAMVGEFIALWQQLESQLQRRLGARGHDLKRSLNPNDLMKYDFLTEEEISTFDRMRRIRNALVHRGATEIPPESLHSYTLELEDLLNSASKETVLERLYYLDPDSRNLAILSMIEDAKHELLEREELTGPMAETNAADFDIEDIEIQDVEFNVAADVCSARFSFAANGEQLPDRMFAETSITGTAMARIDPLGHIEFDEIVAELDVDHRVEYDSDDGDPYL